MSPFGIIVGTISPISSTILGNSFSTKLSKLFMFALAKPFSLK